jgi:dTDP-4-amino-4,6-dideoxygalactose transaminase
VRDHGKATAQQIPSDYVAGYRVTALGNNYRLSELHAAFARAQLRKLPEFRERRRKAHAALRDRLGDIPGLEFQACRPGAGLS